MAGDAPAFEELVRAYDTELKKVCYVITGDRQRAEDAAQSAWEIAWLKLNQVRTPAKVRQWLISVAANEARRLTRHQPSESSEVESPASDGLRDLDLSAALSRLSVVDRQLLSLTFVAGLTSAETGSVLRLSPEGVRTRKARILTRLREELGDD
jgi:RNA polymerase sigma factor (sigma-70 family)